jgi:hypothetical protein
MTRRTRLAVSGALLVAAAALALPAAVSATPDASATVQFGTDQGSSFPPPQGHDASSNAKDNLVPRTVVIGAGGNVTFNIFTFAGFHQPMIYEPGTEPDDITLQPFPAVPFLNDPDGLLVTGPNVPTGGSETWTPPAGTFSEPGRYLLICNFNPHFQFFNMYGWVQVK